MIKDSSRVNVAGLSTSTLVQYHTKTELLIVKSSHYYLYSALKNANCVKTALHQLDIKLGGFTSALQYLGNSVSK